MNLLHTPRSDGRSSPASLGYERVGVSTRPPQSAAAIAALIMVFAAFPAGAGIDIAIGRKNSADAAYADGIGLTVVILVALVGVAAAWDARRRIRRSNNRLGGMTTAVVAMTFGVFVLLSCLVAIVRPGTP